MGCNDLHPIKPYSRVVGTYSTMNSSGRIGSIPNRLPKNEGTFLSRKVLPLSCIRFPLIRGNIPLSAEAAKPS